MILIYSRAHKRAIRMSKIELARALGGLDLIQKDRRTAFRVRRWSKGLGRETILPIYAYLSEHPSSVERRTRFKQRRAL